VEVSNASVQSKPVDGSDEKFKPWTPGQVQYHVIYSCVILIWPRFCCYSRHFNLFRSSVVNL